MNKSELFKAAHKLAKSIIKLGDNYRVTFGACIKAIKEGFVMSNEKLIKSVEFAIKKGALTRWTKDLIDRAYVTNFDYNGGSGLVAKLHAVGISAENAFFDFASETFEFKNLRRYASKELDMQAFEGTDEQMAVRARNTLKKFLNEEMKK